MSEGNGQSGSDATAGEAAFCLEYLRAHDAFCPLCKYNLRNLTQPRCPECGREIKLTVGLTEPHLRALVLLLVALCLAAGCGILSFVIFMNIGLRDGYWPGFDKGWAEAVLIYGATASIFPALIGIFGHRRFIRLPKVAQYLLVALAWAWDGFLFLLLLGLIFDFVR